MFQVAAQIPKDLSDSLTARTAWVKTWGIPLAAVGTVSMALLQTAKTVFLIRRHFQEVRLCKWLTARNEQSAEIAQTDLINLVAAGDRDAFYNSDIDAVCGGIKNALTAVLDYPNLHKGLVDCLASIATEDHLDSLLNPPDTDLFLKPAHQSTPEERNAFRRYAIAKTRVGTEMRFAVDAIQNSIAFQWKKRLQILSILLSGAVGMISLHLGETDFKPSLGASIVIGVLSGFLVPVRRDLVAAVESWKS